MTVASLVCPSCRVGALRRHCPAPGPGVSVIHASHLCDLVQCTACGGYGLPPGTDGTSRRWVDKRAEAA